MQILSKDKRHLVDGSNFGQSSMAIEGKKKSVPCTESWDDFLDFSRMRMPSVQVIAKRLVENCFRFSGNYIWVWIVITLLYGMFIHWKLLGALITIAVGWFAAGVLDLQSKQSTVRDKTSERYQTKNVHCSSSKVRIGKIVVL